MNFLCRGAWYHKCSNRKHGDENTWDNVCYYVEQGLSFENEYKLNLTEIFRAWSRHLGNCWAEDKVPLAVSLIVVEVNDRCGVADIQYNFVLVVIIRLKYQTTVLPIEGKQLDIDFTFCAKNSRRHPLNIAIATNYSILKIRSYTTQANLRIKIIRAPHCMYRWIKLSIHIRV